jgi:vacuolar protein sorting-associated protein 35
VVWLIKTSDYNERFNVLSTARKHFGNGGMKRIKFTLVPLVFAYLQLARQVKGSVDAEAAAKPVRKIFSYVHEMIVALAGVEEYQVSQPPRGPARSSCRCSG